MCLIWFVCFAGGVAIGFWVLCVVGVYLRAGLWVLVIGVVVFWLVCGGWFVCDLFVGAVVCCVCLLVGFVV